MAPGVMFGELIGFLLSPLISELRGSAPFLVVVREVNICDRLFQFPFPDFLDVVI